jgi:dihydrofolate reductase
MQVSLIVAAAENGAIGKNNQLLWRLPDDLKRFKQLTLGHPMIMGRKTFESIGKPLPGRTSIVVTRKKDYAPEGVVVAHSLENALEIAREIGTEEAFVIGGGELYEQVLPLADTIYLTLVHTIIEGDTYFKLPDLQNWIQTEKITHRADERHAFSFDFVNYSKKTDL